MKKLMFTLCMSVFTISGLTSCKDSQKKKAETTEKDVANVPLKFENPHTLEAFQYYLQIEKSLENDNAEPVKDYAKKMAEATKPNFPKMASIADKISQVSTIEEQRMAFAELSDAMEEIANESISSGKLYKQFCPMANNNDGAYWLSTIKEINNPYMGKKMPHCGKTDSVIE